MPIIPVEQLTEDHRQVSVAIEHLLAALRYGAKCAEAGLDNQPGVANQHALDFYNRVSLAQKVLGICKLPA